MLEQQEALTDTQSRALFSPVPGTTSHGLSAYVQTQRRLTGQDRGAGTAHPFHEVVTYQGSP